MLNLLSSHVCQGPGQMTQKITVDLRLLGRAFDKVSQDFPVDRM